MIARAVGRVARGHGDRRPARRRRSRRGTCSTTSDEVTGDERVKLRDAVGLLRGLAPAWGPYRRMTAKQLGEDLAARGVRTVNSSGTPYLDPADLRRAVPGWADEDE